MALYSWLCSSHRRLYPRVEAEKARQVCLEGALNERLSLQVGLYLEGENRQTVRVEAEAPKGLKVRVRRVDWVLMPHFNTPLEPSPEDRDGVGHIPGYVPDVLVDSDSLLLPAEETHAFWLTLDPARNAEPGEYPVVVRVIPENGKAKELRAKVRLHPLRLNPRKNFPVTHWVYADCIMDWYKTDSFDKRFWELMPAFFADMVDHGQDTIYVPMFTPPLDGIKNPCQLLRVAKKGKDQYRFDWRDVKRYVDQAKKAGFKHFEWVHLLTQWGAEHADHIYEGQGRDRKLLWPASTKATSKTHRVFLEQFFPAFRTFLEREKLLKKSFFHLSDEPHGEEHLKNYKKARGMMAELAPWMKFMDALTQIEFGRQKITDMPIPSIGRALEFIAEDIPCWCYYCCHPRGKWLNRLHDTPLPKIAMHGMLFYRWPFKGFLHWGYNYWYRSQTTELIDPFVITDGDFWHRSWAYGDTCMVYPGDNGPLDSIRWEVFAESLQDYRLLQTLGVDRDDPLFEDIRAFNDFPKTEEWRRKTRAALFKRAAQTR